MSDPKQLFVGNLAWETSDEKLKSVFEDAYPGMITHVNIVRDRNTRASLGYGFVKFTDADAARSALEKKIVDEIDGRSIRIEVKTSTN